MAGGSLPVAVLFVDDEPEARDLVASRLEAETDRIDVETAATAAAGLERLGTGGIDCVVSDYHLTETTAIEFLGDVREADPALPFIVLSRTGSEEAASTAVSAGVTDYVINDPANDQYALLARKVCQAVDRRRAEQAAGQTDRLLHELTEKTNDVLFMFSGDWSETLYVNGAYVDVFGQSTDRLQADPMTFLEAVHPDDHAALTAAMERVSDGSSARITYRVQPTADTVRWVESHAEPVFEDGTVTRVAGFTRDVTERKEAEADLRRKTEELDAFASVVAHDLRNPLTVATGYLEILEDEPGDTEALAQLRRSLAEMDRLVSDLLTLARRGEVTDDTERVALEDVARTHWLNVPAADATLDVVDDVTLECDPDRLGQALENLYRNAIEHTSGPVTVTVGRLPDGAGFYVEDDGPGIPEADRDRLLEDWQDAAGEGEMSLGLSIVTRIVEAHDWRLDITESDAGGARFDITGVESLEPGG